MYCHFNGHLRCLPQLRGLDVHLLPVFWVQLHKCIAYTGLSCCTNCICLQESSRNSGLAILNNYDGIQLALLGSLLPCLDNKGVLVYVNTLCAPPMQQTVLVLVNRPAEVQHHSVQESMSM